MKNKTLTKKKVKKISNSKSLNLLVKKDWRLVVCSDEHCGHFAGLTHPEWQGKVLSNDPIKQKKATKVQSELWGFFSGEITALQKEKKIDIFVNNGDFLDGDGWRSGGTEQITTDRHCQIQMSKSIVDFINAENKMLIIGTGYHTGNEEDWEEVLAKEIDCKCEAHAWLEINGKVFDFKHHIGTSGVPAGRSGSISREALWAKLWSEKKLIPNPVNYLIRSHAHYFSLVDDGTMISMVTPALQAFGSKYGIRRCNGIPTLGFLSFDIKANGTVTMRKHLATLPAQQEKAVVFK